MKLCCICGKPSITTLSCGEGESNYCLECYNDLMATAYEIEYSQSFIMSFKFRDNEGILREFKITKIIFPIIVKWQAEEVNGNYKFEVRADLDDDEQVVIAKLQKRIIKGVNAKTLSYTTFCGGKILSLKEKGVINIEYDDNTDELPKFIIDGQVFTLEEFGRLLMTYEGYILKYKIIEPSD